MEQIEKILGTKDSTTNIDSLKFPRVKKEKAEKRSRKNFNPKTLQDMTGCETINIQFYSNLL